MVEVRRSTVVEAPIEEVWAILRDFNGHETWHPSVGASRLEDGASGDMIGAVRDFRLHDGSRIREQLLALSDVETSFTYCIIEAPVMLRNYHATVRLRPVTSDGECFWERWARFDPSAADKQRLSRFVAHDIFEAGFQSVRALFRGERRFTAPGHRSAIPVASSVGAVEAAAIVVTRHGGPNVMEMHTVRVEAPGPGEVRIRHTAIGVNYIDIYARNGSSDPFKPPAVPRMQAVGAGESIGPDVASLKPGPCRLCLRAARRLYNDAHDECRAGLPASRFSQRRGRRGYAAEGHFRRIPLARCLCGETRRHCVGACGCGRSRFDSVSLGGGARRHSHRHDVKRREG